MSEIFMTINHDSKLYADYFDWWNGQGDMLAAANSVFEQFGIESNRFYSKKDRLIIEPTESDKKKFADMMMADGQSFKKRSAPNKAWVDAMKNVKHMRKPQLFGYMPTSLLGCRWKEQLFHVGEILYCKIDSSSENTVAAHLFWLQINLIDCHRINRYNDISIEKEKVPEHLFFCRDKCSGTIYKHGYYIKIRNRIQ